jgi:Transglycosylase SLT domain/SPOR domain
MTRSRLSTSGVVVCFRPLRNLASLALAALLAACAGHGPPINQSQEAAQYVARARGNYVSPGPPDDPWGPYIVEAAERFDVPERWIREVMRVESGGNLYQDGQLITSGAGAMGLMQVMPETYDEMRARYFLGDDAYDPHNNILAGAAYMREMYDVYGVPGFLAAYNAGPKRLDDYLSNNRGLPDETRRYVAEIAPYILDSHPVNRSPSEQYAMNALPIDIPPGPRHPRLVVVARRGVEHRGSRGTVQVAAGRDHAKWPPPPRIETAVAVPAPTRGPHLVEVAMAEPLPPRRSSGTTGHWAVQVGAFGNPRTAHEAAGMVRDHAAALASARTSIASLREAHGTLYRARLTGLSRSAAIHACERLNHTHRNCIVLSPSAQF